MKSTGIGAWWRRRRARREAASSAALLGREQRGVVRAALRVLRDSGLERGLRGGRALPWYLVLGDGQAGKSSALRAAGFDPVNAAGTSDGSPTAVEVWCSGQAVAWELKGRSFELGPADPGWRALLRELSCRRRRPLEGVVLCVPVELLLAPGADVTSSAQRLRHGLTALELQLGLQLPVYLLLTRVDVLPDFAAFWSGIEAELCQEPWGASWVERTPAAGSFAPLVTSELALLGQVLHARALHLACVGGAREPAALFGFPARFAELSERLAAFVHELTELRPCRARAALRGFYLCTAQPPSADAQGSGWFFRELFRVAILADRGASRRSTDGRRRDRVQRALLLGAVLVGALAVVVPASLSRARNLELIASTAAVLEPPLAQPEAGGREQLGQELDPLLTQLEQVEEAARGFRVRNWWGPYSAPALRDGVARAYEAALWRVLSGPVQEQLLATLRSIEDVARFDWTGFLEAQRALKLYLMLTEPQRLDVEWAVPGLVQVWERARQRGACASGGALERHARRWLRAVAAAPSRAWSANPERARGVQARLSALPLEELALSWLGAQAEGVPALRATDVFDARAARVWSVGEDIGVPGLYTRPGWERVRPALDRAIVPGADAWVFGQAAPPGAARERLQQRYFARYARAWRDFARALGRAPGAAPGAASTPWGSAATLERIELLGETDGPLVRWFQRLESNARLELAASAPPLAERAVAALGERLGAAVEVPLGPLEQELGGLLAFGFGDARASVPAASSPLSEYQKELRGLLAVLRQEPAAASGGAPTSPAPREAALRQVAQTVERLLGALGAADRAALEGLLLAPIDGGLAALRRAAAARLAEHWRTEVVQPARQLFERYPFRRGAAEEVGLAEVKAYFEPHAGVLWKFVESQLGEHVAERGGRFTARVLPGEWALAPGVLACLDAARELRDAWFGASGALGVALELRLASTGERASALSFELDGARVAADEAAQRADGSPSAWLSLRWPGSAAAAGAALSLRVGSLKEELRRTGPFGWLRLLEQGGALQRASGGSAFEASWELNHGRTRVRVELRAADGGALDPAPSERLRCPSALFAEPPGDPT